MKCKNCDREMYKIVVPITFTPTPHNRYWYACSKCGARIVRTPDASDTDDKQVVYTLNASDRDASGFAGDD